MAIFGRESQAERSMSPLTIEGTGLRSGLPAVVVLHPRPGPFAFRVDGLEVPCRGLVIKDAERATVVGAGEAIIATVEHLLAACAACGLHRGLAVEVRGGEIPLLDGASRTWADALDPLDLPRVAPALAVAKDETLCHGESRYTFRRGSATTLSVSLRFEDARLAESAVWTGDHDDFVTRIAPARTFAFAHEVAELVERGLATHVDPTAVVVLTPDAVLAMGAPFTADEPARHKLLDLMGDLFLYGGPPVGTIHAVRPGHRATHAILREALCRGVVTS